MRELLSAVHTGEIFDVHPETLRRLYRAGRIPGYRVGRYLRFDPDELREALRSQCDTLRSAVSPATVSPDFDALGAD
jgi:excisionase family DNA binding protein